MRSKQDLVNINDVVVGFGDKEDARRLKLYRRSVHILVLNSDGQILVSKRPFSAKRYRGQYSASAGGHVEKGETYKQAAMRELKEELGIKSTIRRIGSFVLVTKSERTIHELFVAHANIVKPDSSEISEYVFMNENNLTIDMKKHPRRYAKPFQESLKLYLRNCA